MSLGEGAALVVALLLLGIVFLVRQRKD